MSGGVVMSGKVISVISTKGGVGKSTVARFLSIVASEQDKKVCVVDTCQNSSIATGFLRNRDSFKVSAYDWLIGSVKPSEVIQQFKKTNIYYIPSDERVDDYEDWVKKNIPRPKQLDVLRKKIEPLTKQFDYVVIDTHPNEASDIVNYSIAAADYVLIPTDIDLDGVIAAERSVELVREYQEARYNVEFGVVFNKVEKKGKMVSQMEMFKNRLIKNGISKGKILGSIRYSQKISTTKNEGIMLNELIDKYSLGVMSDITAISEKVFARVERGVLNG
jgi:cellulose biosynthesis protein BcsQ